MAGRKPQVQVVTGARASRYDDIDARMKHYLYAMTVRTAGVVLAIFVFHGWLRFVALVAGIGLPWISVTAANAGRSPDGGRPEVVVGEVQTALPPGRGPVIDADN